MDLQQAFIKVKSIKQENFLLDGTYSEKRYWGWKAFNEDCNAIQTALTNHLADFGPSQEALPFVKPSRRIICRVIFSSRCRRVSTKMPSQRARPT